MAQIEAEVEFFQDVRGSSRNSASSREPAGVPQTVRRRGPVQVSGQAPNAASVSAICVLPVAAEGFSFPSERPQKIRPFPCASGAGRCACRLRRRENPLEILAGAGDDGRRDEPPVDRFTDIAAPDPPSEAAGVGLVHVHVEFAQEALVHPNPYLAEHDTPFAFDLHVRFVAVLQAQSCASGRERWTCLQASPMPESRTALPFGPTRRTEGHAALLPLLARGGSMRSFLASERESSN